MGFTRKGAKRSNLSCGQNKRGTKHKTSAKAASPPLPTAPDAVTAVPPSPKRRFRSSG